MNTHYTQKLIYIPLKKKKNNAIPPSQQISFFYLFFKNFLNSIKKS